MRILLAIAGAIVGGFVGGLVGFVIFGMILAGNLANTGAWTLIACTAIFVTAMVGGAWCGSKIAK
jgi:hypothetical protein